jgi:anti-sigma regulatory factor (Ser/Thr protein kinase)
VSAQLSWHVDLRVDGPDLRRAREQVCAALTGWDITNVITVHEALIVVSELVGNALRYGGEVVSVELDLRTDGIVISVLDSSPVLPRPRLAREDDEGGRGLQLVNALSVSWGAKPLPGGKRVWALIRLPR